MLSLISSLSTSLHLWIFLLLLYHLFKYVYFYYTFTVSFVSISESMITFSNSRLKSKQDIASSCLNPTNISKLVHQVNAILSNM